MTSLPRDVESWGQLSPAMRALPNERWRQFVYEALRQVVFNERRKIHDLLIEGVELALKKRGYPVLADLKAKWKRKER